MPEFIIAYVGAKTDVSPEEGAESRARFGAWVGDLGDAIVNPGTPLASPTKVTAEGDAPAPADEALNGFTVVRADDLEAALTMARRCPFLEMGTLQVAEMKQM